MTERMSLSPSLSESRPDSSTFDANFGHAGGLRIFRALDLSVGKMAVLRCQPSRASPAGRHRQGEQSDRQVKRQGDRR
jgi:hypothetical protein